MALTVRSAPAYSIGLPRLPRLGLRGLALAFAGIFLLLTVDAIVQERAFFDLGLLRAIQRLDLPYLAAVLHPVDRLTSGPGAIAAWTLVLVAFTASRWWLPALTMLALPAGGVINEAIGRFIANHVRPDAADVQRVIGETNAPSFPSGHVLGAVLLYGFLFVVADRVESRWLRAAIKTAAVAVIAITGVARLWYGAHWPTDVLGAYAMGGVLLIALICAYRAVERAGGPRAAAHVLARRWRRSGVL